MVKLSNCLECRAPHSRQKYCSKKCSSRFLQKKHRAVRNERARQRLKENPEEERAKRAKAAREWRARHPEKSRKYNRKRLNVGMLANPDDVIFYGYKPPFRKFKDGFGYEGVLMYSKSEGKVQCHLCGGLFRMLNNGHLLKVHGITARQYKEKVGLSQQTALCGEETREKLLKRGHNPKHMEALKRAQRARRARLRKGLPDLQSGFKLSLERKNERGTCPDQLLERIQDAANKLGRVPTGEEFIKMNEGKYMGSIRNTFGTWTNAVAKLGMKTYREIHTRDTLIAAMQNFFQVHKRTPRWSDMERGLLPSASCYYSHFKNINHARLLAKVPLIVAVGRRHEEWTPTDSERDVMLTKMGA